MAAYPDISDDIRHMFNAARDGTASDAVRRQLCRVALSECCVADDQHPEGKRYPTRKERHEARLRLEHIKRGIAS
jgi:hypothetical protein